jgi:hypothetical protein
MTTDHTVTPADIEAYNARRDASDMLSVSSPDQSKAH